MAEFKIPTLVEFDQITRRTADTTKHQLLAVSARYDRRHQRVMITLNSGTVVGFPLSVLPGLERATSDDLRKIEVEGGGYGLRVATLDVPMPYNAKLEQYCLPQTDRIVRTVKRVLPGQA